MLDKPDNAPEKLTLSVNSLFILESDQPADLLLTDSNALG